MSGLSRSVVPLRLASRKASTDALAKFKTINKLASEGKWDSINNAPKLFLFGQAKRETYAAFNAINHNADFFASTPYGQYLKFFWRVGLLLATVKVGHVLYETVVPEQKRLHYKYRNQHGHGHEEHH